MNNPSGLIGAQNAGPGRFVRVKRGVKGFLEGGRFVTPSDPPFRVPDNRAGDLIEAGLVEACAQFAVAPADMMNALHPEPPRPERAVDPGHRRAGRATAPR